MNKCIKPFTNILRHFNTNNNLVETVNNFTKNNMKYLDFLDIKFRHPNKLDIIHPTIYEGTIQFSRNKMILCKTFNNNNLKKLMDEMNEFVDSEIKL